MHELELILTDIFKCSRTDLYLNAPSIAFRDKQLRTLEKILKDRDKVKPIQYILGHTEFMGMRLNVRKGVLIPRPETEILVETVINKVKDLQLKTSAKILSGPASLCGWKNMQLKILDIGTGSGCIAITLVKSLQNTHLVALDISREALDLARENVRLNQADGKIIFLESDLFSHNFFQNDIKFDMIVSNPPYVPTKEIGIFDAKINSEPRVALDGGKDGLDFYRRINKEAGRFLKDGGLLFLELGYGQAEKIKEIFSERWLIEKIVRDYQNIDRVCVIKKKNHG